MDATPEEREAMLALLRQGTPGADESTLQTPGAAELLRQVRERRLAIEGEALKMLRVATRNQASRSGGNSKYMQFAWLVILVAGLAVLILYLLHFV